MVMRGPEAQGRPLLRPVRARLRDPRDARPAAAHVPDPHVHERQVRPAPPARPAVPLRAHREVRGAVRRRHRPRRLRRASSTSCSTSSTASTTRSSTGSRSGCTRRADELEFERAARLRDQLASVRKAIERQQMVGATRGGLRPHRHRRGRARSVACRSSTCARAGSSGARASSSTRSKTSRRPALVAPRRRAALRRRRRRRHPQGDPRPGRARGPRALRGVPRAATAESKVRIRVPQRGGKRELLETATLNARRGVRSATSCKRASDHNARARALVALQEALDLPEAPLRIECFDISQPPGHRDRRRRWW